MNLLPKSREEFASKTYWDDFFRKRKDAFEWYGEYSDLCGVIHSYCKTNHKILMAGCGNSKLSEDMYDVGYHDIVNIDISDLVIKQMLKKNQVERKNMKYMKMDVKCMTFDNEMFDMIIDKGTLDALFTDNTEENIKEVVKMFNEYKRVIKDGGCYICITLAQTHIAEQLLEYFPDFWLVRIHRVDIVNDGDVGKGIGSKLPVFAFAFTKTSSKLQRQVLELYLSEHSEAQTFMNIEEIKTSVRDIQAYAIIQNKLEHEDLGDEVVKVDLWSDLIVGKEPRYTLTVVDTETSKLSNHNGSFAIFIVPQGREMEATFSTNVKALAKIAGFLRLVVATLHRGHVYTDLEEIKSELSEKVMELAPNGHNKKTQVPFLTASESVGSRCVIYEAESPTHGSYLIEDIQSADQYYYRQLVFRSAQNKALSQVRLMIDKASKKKSSKLKKRLPDHRYLMQSHHKAMLAGFSLLHEFDFKNPGKLNLLVFGIRGGCLMAFLLELFSDIHVTCIEEDLTMIDVSMKWFNLQKYIERINFVEDTDAVKGTFDVIIIEHKEKEERKKILANCKTLFTTGLMILREFDEHSNEEELCKMQKDFPLLYSTEEEDGVQILYCLSTSKNEDDDKKLLNEQNSVELKNFIYSKRPGFYDKTEWNVLLDYIEDLFEV